MNSDDDFERAMRARYAEAATRLSARTQAQLHNRLQAAVTRVPRASSRRPAWSLAAASVLVLALAFGLQWRAGHEAMPSPAQPLAANGDSDEALATLDENPDLYLWLASSDAIALASE